MSDQFGYATCDIDDLVVALADLERSVARKRAQLRAVLKTPTSSIARTCRHYTAQEFFESVRATGHLWAMGESRWEIIDLDQCGGLSRDIIRGRTLELMEAWCFHCSAEGSPYEQVAYGCAD